MPVVTLDDFARSFGTTAEDVREKCADRIAQADFSYTPLEGDARDALILSVLKRIEEDRQVIGAPERQKVWDKGWEENLNDFIGSGYDLGTLVPRFIRHGQPVRFKADYIQPANPSFELDYFAVFRQWLFKTYFSSVSHVYEFGCGTGFNLVALARLYPEKRLFGLDFVPSSAELVNRIAEHHRFSLSGHLFDMITPDRSFALEKGSAVLTIGSVEQLASRFEAFIDYLREQPVSLCVHVEPAIELYDEDNLVDYLAIRFQGKRGYTRNLLPHLKELERAGKVEVLKVKRLYFGSLYMEGYNCMVWRAVRQV